MPRQFLSRRERDTMTSQVGNQRMTQGMEVGETALCVLPGNSRVLQVVA